MLDYSLGVGLDGPEVAVLVRKMIGEANLEQPYICCCTAYTEESFKNKAFEAGMDDFLTKPVKHSNLS